MSQIAYCHWQICMANTTGVQGISSVTDEWGSLLREYNFEGCNSFGQKCFCRERFLSSGFGKQVWTSQFLEDTSYTPPVNVKGLAQTIALTIFIWSYFQDFAFRVPCFVGRVEYSMGDRGCYSGIMCDCHLVARSSFRTSLWSPSWPTACYSCLRYLVWICIIPHTFQALWPKVDC